MVAQAGKRIRLGRDVGKQLPLSQRFWMKIRVFSLAVVLALCACTVTAQTPLEKHLQGIAWERYQDQAVQLLQEYLRLDTSNPPGNELRAADFFHRLFDEQGISNTVFTYAPGRANLYAILKGDGSQRPLFLLTHSDVAR